MSFVVLILLTPAPEPPSLLCAFGLFILFGFDSSAWNRQRSELQLGNIPSGPAVEYLLHASGMYSTLTA